MLYIITSNHDDNVNILDVCAGHQDIIERTKQHISNYLNNSYRSNYVARNRYYQIFNKYYDNWIIRTCLPDLIIEKWDETESVLIQKRYVNVDKAIKEYICETKDDDIEKCMSSLKWREIIQPTKKIFTTKCNTSSFEQVKEWNDTFSSSSRPADV
jgi:hypothetical protein